MVFDNEWLRGGPCVGGCSEVTLNVCLGREFSGGELYFGALRGEGDEDEVVLTYQPQPGRAVIHPGEPIAHAFNVYIRASGHAPVE